MGVNSLPKTVTRQRRDCDLNPGPSAAESNTLTTRLPSHRKLGQLNCKFQSMPTVIVNFWDGYFTLKYVPLNIVSRFCFFCEVCSPTAGKYGSDSQKLPRQV